MQDPFRRDEWARGRGSPAPHHTQAVEFPPVAESVRHARQHVRRTLEGRVAPDLAGTVELLVSELATNAVLHASSPFSLLVGMQPPRLRVEVHDRDDELPELNDSDLTAPAGRGIHIIDTLAARWGAFPTPSGKAVWFEFDC